GAGERAARSVAGLDELQQTVARRAESRRHGARLGDRREQGAEVGDRLIALGGIGDTTPPQRVGDHHDAARACDPQSVLHVVQHGCRIRIHEHQVVGAVVHARQHVGGAPGDEARAGGRDAGVGVRLPGPILMIDLDVDRGERRPGCALQQPEAADSGAGADLEDAVGVDRRGQHGELRARRGRDRVDAELEGVLTGELGRGRLHGELLRVFPAQIFVAHIASAPSVEARSGGDGYPERVSFGLTFDKILIILVIAIFLVGPDRLPGYAAQLARLTRSLRDMANGAKDRMREEMGPEFDEVDWAKLDPRKYDPRRISRDARLEESSEAPVPAGPPMPVRSTATAYELRQRVLGKGPVPPYDAAATEAPPRPSAGRFTALST